VYHHQPRSRVVLLTALLSFRRGLTPPWCPDSHFSKLDVTWLDSTPLTHSVFYTQLQMWRVPLFHGSTCNNIYRKWLNWS
jgi:hypothetical protein